MSNSFATLVTVAISMASCEALFSPLIRTKRKSVRFAEDHDGDVKGDDEEPMAVPLVPVAMSFGPPSDPSISSAQYNIACNATGDPLDGCHAAVVSPDNAQLKVALRNPRPDIKARGDNGGDGDSGSFVGTGEDAGSDGVVLSSDPCKP